MRNRSRQKISRRVASTDWSSSSVAGSTDRKPVTALKRNGMTHTNTVMTRIDRRPGRVQITMAGAYAMIGVTWMSTATGCDGALDEA